MLRRARDNGVSALCADCRANWDAPELLLPPSAAGARNLGRNIVGQAEGKVDDQLVS
jgi:hypothetical protein